MRIWLLKNHGVVEGAYVSEVLARADADRLATSIADLMGIYTTGVVVEPVEIVSRALYSQPHKHLTGVPLAEALRVAQATWPFLDAATVFGPKPEVSHDEYLAIHTDDGLKLPEFQFHHQWVLHQGTKEIRAVFQDARWTDAQIVLWFLEPHSDLHGVEPALLLPHDPNRVLAAARRAVTMDDELAQGLGSETPAEGPSPALTDVPRTAETSVGDWSVDDADSPSPTAATGSQSRRVRRWEPAPITHRRHPIFTNPKEPPMDPLWLVWRGQRLVGLYATREGAQAALDQAPTHTDRDAPHPQTEQGRIDPWTLARPPSPPIRDGVTTIDAIDAMAHDWGLLRLAEMGTGHFFHVETYLAVPHEGVLKFPAYQFTPERVLWPGFREAVNTLREGRWDDTSIALWFISHQGSADGEIPALVLRTDPHAVLKTAQSTAASL